MDFSAYGQAVIHLAWHRNDKICELLFGMIELRPLELPHAPGCRMKSFRVGNKDRRYVYYERFAVPVSHAIEWYESVISGRLVLADDAHDPTTDRKSHLNGGPFVQEPRWPGLVTSNDLVFAPNWMYGSNFHFLFPKKAVSSEIMEDIASGKVRSQLEEWLKPLMHMAPVRSTCCR